MSDKPKFDPNQPFEVASAKPKFDPSLPYEAKDPEQPGVSAIGAVDGNPTPAAENEGTFSKLKKYGGKALQVGGKVLNYPEGAITAPLLGLGLEAATGKKTFSGDEYLKGIDPTTTQTFPSANELYKRAGIPEGAKLSDYLNMYSEPGKASWYQPEKGGLLDPTVRGTGGVATDMAIDPLNYISFGEAGALKQALSKGAARMAAEQAAKDSAGPVGKVLLKLGDAKNAALDTLSTPAQMLAQKVKSIPVAGPAISKVATAPSDALDWLGKKFYNSGVLPVEQEGAKFGKDAVSETLYNSGIKSSLGLSDKADRVANNLMNGSNAILDKAGAAGAKVDMNASLEEARQAAAKIRAEGRPKQQWIADQLEKSIAEHEAMVVGKEAVPASTKAVDTGLLDEAGQPITRSEVVPGQAAIPGREITPRGAADLVTDQYKATPDAAWNEVLRTPEGAQITKPMASGLRQGYLDSVSQTLGPGAAAKAAELRGEAGKILSTQRATRRVENQADRLLHGAVSPTGTAKVMATLVGPKGAMLDMAGNAARLSTMPVGYGMRKLAEGQLTAPLIDAYLRRKYVDKLSNQPQGVPDGQ